MTIESDQSVEFQSYQGLQRVVHKRIGIYEPLNTLIEWLRQIEYRSTDPPAKGNVLVTYEYKRSVRLLDTFLVGSMRIDVVQNLVKDSMRFGIPIQVLILDPYSPLAQLRAKKISTKVNNKESTRSVNQGSKKSDLDNAIGKANNSLFLLLDAIGKEVSSERLEAAEISIPESMEDSSIEFLDRLIELIQESKNKNIVDLEVKFYRSQTEVPVYLISRFVAKGLVFSNTVASKNPWLIFVDDRTQVDDIYDNFSKAFDDIWKNESSPHPIQPSDAKISSYDKSNLSDRASRRVFIVHGRDTGARDTVARFLTKLELEPVVLAEQASEGKTVIEKFEQHSDVGYAIVLLTPDDIGYLKGKQLDKKPRARQNVVLELGYFLGKLPRNRVCALSKGDMEIPSDYHGVLREEMDENGAWKLKLAQEMKTAGLMVDLNKL